MDCKTASFVGGITCGAILVCLGTVLVGIAWCAAALP